ncbi:MAG: MoxR family ATPase [Bacteroidota bacterium]
MSEEFEMPLLPEEEREQAPEAETLASEVEVEQTNFQYQQNRIDLRPVQEAVEGIKQELRKVIIGQEEMIDLLLVALFVRGHVLIEGVPGIAKTLTARMMARTMDAEFSRIQFTPDLMPSDVVGTSVFNMKTSEFSFNAGPIFANIILIDEINRAPAKTQAALFEVMEEAQVTVDGKTFPMKEPFFVLATQNPIEQEGTYKLPEAQLDRFLFKINMEYPSREEEKAILLRFRKDFSAKVQAQVERLCSPTTVEACRMLVEQVYIADRLLDYIADVVHNTRNHADLYLGASPRASLALMKAAKAVAALNNRDFVTPDDIQYVAYPVLNHRVILTPEREMEGYSTKNVVDNIIQQLEVPR